MLANAYFLLMRLRWSRQLRFIGKGVHILPRARFFGGECITLHDGVSVGRGTVISAVVRHRDQQFAPSITIGADTILGAGCLISSNSQVQIGAHVEFAPEVFITDHIHRYDNPLLPSMMQRLTQNGHVIIEDDCFLGLRSVILPDVHVGTHAIIGAGAVVTRDVPSYSVVVGVPARVVKRFDEESKSWLTC